MNKGRFMVKAFRGDGTPTVNDARFYDDAEEAKQTAKNIAGVITGGWVELSEWSNLFNNYMLSIRVFCYKNPKDAAAAAGEDRAARIAQ